jgi:hypothetical protein
MRESFTMLFVRAEGYRRSRLFLLALNPENIKT